MSNLCSDSVLTGQEGTILFTPPGTSACVRDFAPFFLQRVYLTCGVNFIVGDKIKFEEEDGGNLDSALTASTMTAGLGGVDEEFGVAPMAVTEYYVVATGIAKDTDVDGLGVSMGGLPYINVSTTENGTPITFKGDGGTGSANTALPAHINISLSEYQSVCGVRDFSIDVSRDELDVTTLPCAEDVPGSGCDTLVEFRKTQAGYATATGTMTVYFTCDQTNISNRLLSSSILRNQGGAKVKLYVCATYESGKLVDNKSLFVEADITISGLSFSVNPDDATTAELSFSVRKMTSMFGLT